MIFSNHLSRNVNIETKPNEPTCKGLDLKVHNVFLNASGVKCGSLANETAKDSVLTALKHIIIKGWPNKCHEYPKILKDYWNYHDELSILDGLVLKGTCIVVPK